MTRPGGTSTAKVWKVHEDRGTDETDQLAAEEPMEIRVTSGRARGAKTTSLSVTMRTPGHDFELAAGFLFTEGIIEDKKDLLRIEYCTGSGVEQEYNIVSAILRPEVPFDPAHLERHVYMTSSCGVCGKTSLEAVRVRTRFSMPHDRPKVKTGTIGALPDRLMARQSLFAKTGGLHAAGLFDSLGNLEILREDVGRHNAVDKLIGERFLAGRIPLREAVLVVSGRASFEIVQKAAVAGIPFVVAVGAPTNLAVELASEVGMTLVGFARGDRFNAYAGRERILGSGG